MMLHGIDVSDDQGAIDWRQATGHTAFAAVQVGFGTAHDIADTHTGQANVHGALVNGFKVAPYFFAYPKAGNAKMEGGEFGRLVGDFEAEGAEFDLPLAVDVEVNPEAMSSAAMSQWVRDFLAATGYDPKRLAVYSNPGFWDANTDGTPINAHCWVAAYGAPSAPRLKGLPAPFMWQTTNKGRMPGIQGAVDLDTLLFVPQGDPHPDQGDEGAVTWTVLQGQTLESVAAMYAPKNATTLAVAHAAAALAAYNRLTYPVALKAGDQIKVPQPIL